MISIHRQVDCIERELSMRRAYYHVSLVDGNISKEEADRQIAELEQVLTTLKSLAPAERTLFEEQ